MCCTDHTQKDCYSPAADYYDILYSFKDYTGEAGFLAELARKKLGRRELTLLDVACGTGKHVALFNRLGFSARGMDLSQRLLAEAKRNFPDVTFYKADMTDFSLGEKFDVVTCLFSAIGYSRTVSGLNRTISSMTRHLNTPGLLLIEPWFTPDQWRADTVHMSVVDEPDLKVVRMNTSKVRDGISVLDLHYLIGTREDTKHIYEKHELGLFSGEEMESAFRSAGLDVQFTGEGPSDRGLYLGIRSG